MPILYVHGVNVRSRQGFLALDAYLRRYIAPIISASPQNVLIDDMFWGDAGIELAWGGASRPRSRVLGMGAGATDPGAMERVLTASALASALARVPEPSPAETSSGGLIAGGDSHTAGGRAGVRLHDLKPDELADLLAWAIAAEVAEPFEQARLVLAADDVARDAATPALLLAAATVEAELDVLLAEVHRRAAETSGLLAAGAATSLARLRDRLNEGLGRALSLPTYSATVAMAELRKPLNDLVSVFLGDVFKYLTDRGDASQPGEIMSRLLRKLEDAHANKTRRDNEPLVVLSHSMGGQIVYDAVSHFLRTPGRSHLNIDFWCATASQVGFFEEAKLFLASRPQYKAGNPVPFPSNNLGVWWNVWDHNDVLSFTARDIFTGVDDEPYDSGLSLTSAHGGYLKRPSFFRRFADKLAEAKQSNWRTP